MTRHILTAVTEFTLGFLVGGNSHSPFASTMIWLDATGQLTTYLVHPGQLRALR